MPIFDARSSTSVITLPGISTNLGVEIYSIGMTLELPSNGTVRGAESISLMPGRIDLSGVSTNLGVVMFDLLLFDLLRRRIGDLGGM